MARKRVATDSEKGWISSTSREEKGKMRDFAVSGEITSGYGDAGDEKAYEYVGEFARGCAVGLKGVVGSGSALQFEALLQR